MKKYKVIYYIGDKVDIKIKADSGFVIIDNDVIKLTSKKDEYIANLVGTSQISLFMMNGLGSMLRLEIESRTMFLSVVRFCIAGQFAMVNAIGTRKLKKLLESYSTAK